MSVRTHNPKILIPDNGKTIARLVHSTAKAENYKGGWVQLNRNVSEKFAMGIRREKPRTKWELSYSFVEDGCRNGCEAEDI